MQVKYDIHYKTIQISMRKVFLLISAMLLLACDGSVNKQSNALQEDSLVVNLDSNVIATQISQHQVEKNEMKNVDQLVGSYYNAKSTDEYIFKADGTGIFVINSTGGNSERFRWKRIGRKVTITIEGFNPSIYEFDPKAETITEYSESFGTLIYNKE